MFRTEPTPLAASGRHASRRSRMDITEYLAGIGYAPTRAAAGADASPIMPPAACSTASGSPPSRRRCCAEPASRVVEPAEAHLCCGSAGTYNLLQPEIAERLRARKLREHRTPPSRT